MGVVSTAPHALPEHGRSAVNDHFDVLNCKFHDVAASLGSPYLVRGSSFPLRWNTVLSAAADGHRSVAPTFGQGSHLGCDDCARIVWSKELCHVCVCADANGQL